MQPQNLNCLVIVRRLSDTQVWLLVVCLSLPGRRREGSERAKNLRPMQRTGDSPQSKLHNYEIDSGLAPWRATRRTEEDRARGLVLPLPVLQPHDLSTLSSTRVGNELRHRWGIAQPHT